MRNPLSLEALRDWLKQQDPQGTYNFVDGRDCLLARYLRFVGLPVQDVDPHDWRDTNLDLHPLPPGMNAVARPEEWTGTYGAALQRAEKLIASSAP